ncbi:MAG TPA: polysaccharide deacetylase family protein [Gemmatimonadales bacterium]|nr:polysaccharide deacetylase family protein [Gemmatimonadales bacterium]
MTFLASFDIEDWFHAENVKGALPTDDWDQLEARVERNTHELLDALGAAGVKATCFVLGWVARRYPGLVRRMAAEGHEVASHSDTHRRLYSLSRAALAEDLTRARETLEQLTGERVWGIRAPMFSISDAVLDYLVEAGYWYDSSFYDFKAHDRYGQLHTPIDPEQPVVEVRPGLLELPMSRVRIGPMNIPWSGGGYFRLIPPRVYRWGVKRRLAGRSWFMFYFHPWELDDEERPPPGLSPTLRFRAYVGRGRMRRDLPRLLRQFGSLRIDDTLRRLGYSPPVSAARPLR